jgi:hypothetical protein
MLKFSEVMFGFSQAFATLEMGIRKMTLSLFFRGVCLLGILRNDWSGVLDFVCSCFFYFFHIKFYKGVNEV